MGLGFQAAIRVYGCDLHTVRKLNEGMSFEALGSRSRAYFQQRSNARSRRIPWEISFPEWVSLWLDSGRFGERGTALGQYVMARSGDVGPYKVGNVSIQPNRQNNRDAMEKARPKITKALIGAGRGWRYVERARIRPYAVQFRGKYLGAYSTEAEATRVYRAAAAEYLGQP